MCSETERSAAVSDVEFLSEPQPVPPEDVLGGPAPAAHGSRGRWIAASVAAVVLVGGGTATYVALSAGSGGSDTATAAVQQVVGDVEHGDMLGLLDDLAPGERDALTPAFRSSVADLKRLGVLSASADPSAVTGITVTGSGLTYAESAVNDHVKVVTIDGGTLTMHGDVSKLPLAPRLLHLAESSAGSQNTQTDTANLARHPVRVAAEQVDGRWYASLAYTVADAAASHRVPPAGSAVTAAGASSPTDAVRSMLGALTHGNLRGAVALLSPAEASAVQDYAGMFLQDVPPLGGSGVSITDLQLTSTPVSDGIERVQVKSATIRTPAGSQTMTVDGSCVTVTGGGQDQKICADQIGSMIPQMFGAVTCVAIAGGTSGVAGRGFSSYGPLPTKLARGHAGYGTSGGVSGAGGSGKAVGPVPGKLPRRYLGGSGAAESPGCSTPTFKLTQEQQDALSRIFGALLNAGLETQQVGGQWYVAPVRSFTDEIAGVLHAMHDNDIWTLAAIGQ